MERNKKVVESAIVAFMLVIVTAITAISNPEQTKEVTEENIVVAVAQKNGVAGIIHELAQTQESTELVLGNETASIEKAENVTVAEAHIEPQLSAEEQEWSDKLMANVEEFLNVRSQPDENSEVVGKLYRDDRAEAKEQIGDWTHIVSGNVDGYVKTEYCFIGTEALTFAQVTCNTTATVMTAGLRLRNQPNEDSDVYTSVYEGTQLKVKLDAEPVTDWVVVDYKGNTAYVKAEFVEVSMNYGAGITIAEEQAMIQKAQEEAAAKQAKQQASAGVTQNGGTAASYDEVTLLGALIQCEAGSECYEGQLAVGAVVMNRLRSGYSSSISGVIYQSGQFTPAGSGSVASVAASGVSGSCLQAAQEALAGADNTGGALNFRRASSGHAGTVIGNHVFF